MSYPSTFSSFNRPAASDRLNNPSHSALHNTVSSAVGQLEAVIGLSTSSAVGTIYYDVRSPDSNGGGHVQSANKGGTGQISYTKGDLLVASSTSVLTKLAVGADGQILQANSSVATGTNWVNSQTNKIVSSVVSSMFGSNSALETSIMSVSIPGSTLGINNAVRATLNVHNYRFAGTASILLKANFGSNTVASILYRGVDNGGNGLHGKIEYTLLGNGTANRQRGNVFMQLGTTDALVNVNSVLGISYMQVGSASIASSGDATMGMTIKNSVADGNDQLLIDSMIVEKIV